MATCTFSNCTEQELEEIAGELALAAKPGNLVTLSGDLGAGKTHFCRAFIRSYFGNKELEVPSPTYLVSIEHDVSDKPPIVHMDLYRISDPDELHELGLKELLDHSIVLVEWPENASGELPETTLELKLDHIDEHTRNLSLKTTQEPAPQQFRSALIRKFLKAHTDQEYLRLPLGADASVRDYEIIKINDEKQILMNAPKTPDGPPIKNNLSYSRIAHLAEEVKPFVAIARLLKSRGFSAPEIYAENLDEGLLLLEHLGEDGILDAQRNPIAERYIESGKLLASMHQHNWDDDTNQSDPDRHIIPDYDSDAMLVEVELLTEWYLKDAEFSPSGQDIEDYFQIWKQYAELAQGFRKSIVLRDYHSPNIIWRQDREGHDRIGLIDFQDAMIGPAVYDLVSLAQDARVVVTPELEQDIIESYLNELAKHQPALNRDEFELEYAMMGAQRASKLLGIFIRLHLRDKKPAYRKLIPSIRNYLGRNLQHPALEDYRKWCARVIDL